MFKNYAPFNDCKCEINNVEIDNAKYIDIEMPIYDLTEYYFAIIRKHLDVYDNTIEIH